MRRRAFFRGWSTGQTVTPLILVYEPTATYPTVGLAIGTDDVSDPSDILIDWGDGSTDTYQDNGDNVAFYHTYTGGFLGSEIEVTISGNTRRLGLGTTKASLSDNVNNFRRVKQWGTNAWYNLDDCFYNLRGLTVGSWGTLDDINSTMLKNMESMFFGARDTAETGFQDIGMDNVNPINPIEDISLFARGSRLAMKFNNWNVTIANTTSLNDWGRSARTMSFNGQGFDVSQLTSDSLNILSNLNTNTPQDLTDTYNAWANLTFVGTPTFNFGGTATYFASAQAARDAITAQGVTLVDAGSV